MTELKHSEPQRYPEEQVRADYKAMAGELVGVVDSIIEESRLSKEPKGANLWWFVHGENSFYAQDLEETARTGQVKGAGINLSLNSLDM